MSWDIYINGEKKYVNCDFEVEDDELYVFTFDQDYIVHLKDVKEIKMVNCED